MHIIRGLGNLPPRFRGAAITIGNFDGVHRGHQAVIETLCLRARELKCPSLVMTFEPHPARLLYPERAPRRITGVRGKARWMDACGLDGMLILHFDHELASLAPEYFVQKILVEGLAIQDILIGHDFRFGAGGKGNLDTLVRLGQQYGYSVDRLEALVMEEGIISSTRIRQSIGVGNFALAEKLLGRPFEVEGRVFRGFQRGRTIGFPTANVALKDLLHPPLGVYIVEAWVDEKWLPGVANIGHNPTFGDQQETLLEVHLLSPVGDLYGKVLRVRFHQRIREQKRFDGIEALTAQIRADVAFAWDHFRNLYQ